MLRRSAAAAVALITACAGALTGPDAESGPHDAGNDEDATPRGDTDAARGPEAAAAYDVECTFQWRADGGSFDEKKLPFRSDGALRETIGGLEVDVGTAPDEVHHTLLRIRSKDPDAVQEYRFEKTVPPSSPSAPEGFTGLVHVGRDVRYQCRAIAAPPPAPPTDAPAPIHVRCLVTAQHATTGEKREWIELTAAGAKTFDAGDDHVTLSVLDSDSGRTVLVDTWRSPGGPSEPTTHQVFQPPRSARIDNGLAGTTFTGRFTLRSGSNDELWYVCSSRETGTRAGIPPLGPPCDERDTCPVAGERCSYFTDLDRKNTHCYTGNPCRYLGCPELCACKTSYPGGCNCKPEP